MSEWVIRAEGLGKRYFVGHLSADRERYVALRDVICHNAKRLMRSAGDMIRGRQLIGGDDVEEFWALRDIDFEIKRGEVVGVIGRNGAGKSTLLKILSRITEPSVGRVAIKGRVASLLEVGTGFHPELTGRENIYLNGAILGMTRAEIRRKFDEIVDFAGVEKFLDTPVKRYSSGMYVRLAFAVAAHLEPEILVVDEVLAVGDAEFQKKCLGKMKDVADGGRTVLFVSHNMAAISRLCGSAVTLKDGRVAFLGQVREAIGQYMKANDQSGSCDLTSYSDIIRSGNVSVSVSELIEFRADFVLTADAQIAFEIKLKDAAGQSIGYAQAGVSNSAEAIHCKAGKNTIELMVQPEALASGRYVATVDLTIPFVSYLARAEEGLLFDFEKPGPAELGRTFSQSWGVGSIMLPSKLKGER